MSTTCEVGLYPSQGFVIKAHLSYHPLQQDTMVYGIKVSIEVEEYQEDPITIIQYVVNVSLKNEEVLFYCYIHAYRLTAFHHGDHVLLGDHLFDV